MIIIKNTIPLILQILIISCSNKVPKNKLTIPEKGFEFQIYQWENIKIPSSIGNIVCQTDDITQAHVYLCISENEKIFFKKSIQEGDVDQIKLKDGAIINAENCLKKQL